jgi:hypothetical protein
LGAGFEDDGGVDVVEVGLVLQALVQRRRGRAGLPMST